LPLAPCCEAAPAMDADPKETANQSATKKNVGGRFAIAQGLSAAGNDEVLRAILFIMGRTLDLQMQQLPVTFQRAV
jgi:hypothetical protein